MNLRFLRIALWSVFACVVAGIGLWTVRTARVLDEEEQGYRAGDEAREHALRMGRKHLQEVRDREREREMQRKDHQRAMEEMKPRF
jgi:hypothetical protein